MLRKPHHRCSIRATMSSFTLELLAFMVTIALPAVSLLLDRP
jgi:hypothetical protein